MARASFSVEYDHAEHPDNCCAVDWDHWDENSWIRSWKYRGGSEWRRECDNGGRLNKLVYQAILNRFGLEDFADELTIERVQCMSPAKLMEFRRKMELPAKEVLSDTPGDRQARAEEYE